MSSSVAIAVTHKNLLPQAKQLAQQLQLNIVAKNDKDYPILLVLTPSHLQLQLTAAGSPGAIYADFVQGALGHRRLFGGGRGQLIAKAIGLKPQYNPSVIDVTGGLGRDAFILATLGCTVTMIERQAIIAALVQDGLNRAAESDWFQPLHLQLIAADAKNYLAKLNELPDVIYCDPMYPEQKKSALVKKEMRVLRHIAGNDDDADQLLMAALPKTKKRVVVKRARLAPPLAGPKPDLVYNGKSSRFDIYLSLSK